MMISRSCLLVVLLKSFSIFFSRCNYISLQSASTGTDAQPYFRVFNPLLQSQRFDPKGDFIRKWVPELRNLNDKQIHNPHDILAPKEFAKLR